MVHGDIDLTENLDFYHDKPVDKKLPALPWKSQNNKLSNTGNIVHSIIYDFNSIDYTYNGSTYQYNVQYNVYYRYNDIVDNISNRIYSYNDFVYTTYTMNEVATITTSYDNLIPDDYFDDYIGGYKPILSDKKEHLKSRPKHYMKSAMRHCYHCGRKTIGKCNCRKKGIGNSIHIFMNSNKKSKKDSKRCIRLFKNSSYRNNDNEYLFSSSRDRKIPWLRNLNSIMYDDYIEELKEGQKDYTSYLTNMSWIGVR